jgi:hypothetical protein
VGAILTSPHLIDFVLLVTIAEAVVLSRVFRCRVAIGLLLPGICLLLAVRAALAGVAWPWVPVMAAAAGLAHLVDLRQRWRS